MPRLPSNSTPTPPPTVYMRTHLVQFQEGPHVTLPLHQHAHVNPRFSHRPPFCRHSTRLVAASEGAHATPPLHRHTHASPSLYQQSTLCRRLPRLMSHPEDHASPPLHQHTSHNTPKYAQTFTPLFIIVISLSIHMYYSSPFTHMHCFRCYYRSCSFLVQIESRRGECRYILSVAEEGLELICS